MTFAEVLPVIINMLLIILIVIGIIIGIKLIITIDKINDIADDVKKKLHILDSFFNIMDTVTNKVSTVTDKIVNFIVGIFNKLFLKGKDEEDE